MPPISQRELAKRLGISIRTMQRIMKNQPVIRCPNCGGPIITDEKIVVKPNRRRIEEAAESRGT